MPEFTVKLTKPIIPEEDFSYLRGTLSRLAEEIFAEDEKFHSLANSILVSKGQQGKIIDAVQAENFLRRRENLDIASMFSFKVIGLVNSFSEQIDEMNKPPIYVTYSDSDDAS
ncbi:hypothetical protein [Terribacillus sp. 7520-G]|uniref:hypothetical protein n=1 Tax=Terribacillus TaxID=459532 RepID=UPI000BA62D8B|nr:hypothetical protein [Terribacillus sp. 7520-G]PAD38274.1 hypothetical protein CHH53_11920 [Terribacillus sp. 7520-G]